MCKYAQRKGLYTSCMSHGDRFSYWQSQPSSICRYVFPALIKWVGKMQKICCWIICLPSCMKNANTLLPENQWRRDLTEDNKGENWDWPSVLSSDSNSIFAPNLFTYFNRPGTAGPWLDLCHSLEPVFMLFSSWESIHKLRRGVCDCQEWLFFGIFRHFDPKVLYVMFKPCYHWHGAQNDKSKMFAKIRL